MGEEEAEGIPELFGRNVRKYRKRAGLTQEQLSERIKISQKHLSVIETGGQFASAPLIGRLSRELGVSPAMLFGGYAHEVNYEQANATVLLLRQNIEGQLSDINARLNRMEALLRGLGAGQPYTPPLL